ncbi:hypothetical protein LTS18_001441, partial [Coniosporium uncinatum]
GITKRNDSANKKMVYDDASGEWVPKWGYKGKNKEGDGEWLVEVDDEKAGKEKGEMKGGDGDKRKEGRAERKERVRRQERRERRNEKRGAAGGGGVGKP